MEPELLDKKLDEAWKGWTGMWDLGEMTIRDIDNAAFRHGVEAVEDGRE